MEIKFRPISQWPGQTTPPSRRQRSRFDTKYGETMRQLDRELRHLRAKNVVIQLDCDEREIRRDGMPRSDARCRGPGVILSFEGPNGAVSFPCDHFTEWQDNVRAITLALEALRAVDRYHVTRNGEQYKGWAALPDKSRQGAFADRSAAATWLGKELDLSAASIVEPTMKLLIRHEAIKRFHPDRNDGSDARWKLWLDAAAVLGIEV